MIAIIRIAGQVHMNWDIVDTFKRLKLGKKYTCVLINDTPQMLGMLNKVKDFVAFGNIDEKTLVELLKARGKVIGDTKAKLKDPEKLAKDILAGKKLEDLKIKPFFGLHPARGGINTKRYYPEGVRGNHKEAINKLIMKML
jgi:large subunit ribosomal protein L30